MIIGSDGDAAVRVLDLGRRYDAAARYEGIGRPAAEKDGDCHSRCVDRSFHCFFGFATGVQLVERVESRQAMTSVCIIIYGRISSHLLFDLP